MDTISPKLKDRLLKIQNLINKGATEGERAAARNAFQRILKEHNIQNSISFEMSEVELSYIAEIEKRLLTIIIVYFVGEQQVSIYQGYGQKTKTVKFETTYEDKITLECAWAYFLPHFRNQLKEAKKRNIWHELPKSFIDLFITSYVMKSGLRDPDKIKIVQLDELTEDELKTVYMINNIQGGQFNKQLGRNHHITQRDLFTQE